MTHHGFIDMDGQNVLSRAEICRAWEAHFRANEDQVETFTLQSIMAEAIRRVETLDFNGPWPIPGHDRESTVDMLKEMGGIA